MNIPNLTGWNFIAASQKRHYFLDGRSLCGRCAVRGGATRPGGEDRSADGASGHRR